MKKIILVIILLCTASPIFSQLKTTIDFDFKNVFEGVWVSELYGTKSYKLVFQKQKLYIEPIKQYSEVIVGSIIYLENDKEIRTLPISGFSSPLVGSMQESNSLRLNYTDNIKLFSGYVTFTLKSSNNKVATWVLQRNERGMVSDMNKAPYDLPSKIEFSKK